MPLFYRRGGEEERGRGGEREERKKGEEERGKGEEGKEEREREREGR